MSVFIRVPGTQTKLNQEVEKQLETTQGSCENKRRLGGLRM